MVNLVVTGGDPGYRTYSLVLAFAQSIATITACDNNIGPFVSIAYDRPLSGK